MSEVSNTPSVPHHVLIIETGMGEEWRTWAECQSCDWKGPKRVSPKLADQDAEEHASDL